MGRKSEYTEEIADKICARIASSSDSVVTICKDEDMPSQVTVYKWLLNNEDFAKKYARAREAQADVLAEQIIDIADDGSNDFTRDENGKKILDQEHVQRSKLRIDARKFIAAKLKPKKYGDKIDVTSDGEKLQQTFTLYMGEKEVKEDAVHTPETV